MSESTRSGADLLEAIRSALALRGHTLQGAPLVCLEDKGLAHDHVRLCGTGVLARIPKQSQLNLSVVDNLSYQRSCFERAQDSRRVPRLYGILPPSDSLPRGALLVEEIVGRSVDLSLDLGPIMDTLAAIHVLPMPSPTLRGPLLDEADPLRALLVEITTQAEFLPSANISAHANGTIRREIARLKYLCDNSNRPARCLIAFDGHPGNYVMREVSPRGLEAILVDLEKFRYSYPGLDLAHATLYTSTTWDANINMVLTPEQVSGAYKRWATGVNESLAQATLGWHLPLRRAMWLWSVTWCAKWRCLSKVSAKVAVHGEDWSAQRSDDHLVRHVKGRVDHYLSDFAVDWVQDEFTRLEHLLA